MLLNLNLTDGSIIKECSIFKEDVQRGDQSITDKEEIERMLQRVPWGMKYVSYQNKLIQGKIHVNSIDTYEILTNNN